MKRRSTVIAAVGAVGLFAALALIVLRQQSSDEPGVADPADGLWLMTAMTVDGELLGIGPRPLFLSVDEGRVVTASGRCNGWCSNPDGELGGGALCLEEERNRFDRLLGPTLGNVALTSTGLVLERNGTAVRYERFVDPSPEELFSVLTDPEAAAISDDMSIDPVYGTPNYSMAARLASVGGTDYFVAVDGGVVCLIRSKDSIGVPRCSETYDANFFGSASPLWGPAGLLDPAAAVLIPDQFVQAAGASPHGESFGNLLVMADPPDAAFTLTNDAGNTFTIFPA